MPSDGPARGGTAIESQFNGESSGVSPSADQPAGTAGPSGDGKKQPGGPSGPPGAPAGQADLTGYGAIRSVLRIRPFRRLWIVLGAASFGDWFGLLATSVFAAAQVEGSTAKGVAFGGVIAVRLLPALVLGPIAGVLADRFDRRWTMVICDVLRFLLFASIPLVALLGAGGAVVVG
ncbi:MFS transporter, partial [Micromonospora craterilacus]|uniref:MFS transporter n=1 Tax=Micromonospora craterilacus TaxID=1655439 RepID=UPI001F226E59